VKQTSLVTVVIPAKNEEKNIERLLQSVVNQTYKKLEVIVVDDGSSDNTAKIAKGFTPRVFSRKSEERSSQRNFGAKKARGEYVLFLDADMELESDVIAECVELANSKGFHGVTIPERTVGDSFFARIRNFERKMYMGDTSIEVPRFFVKKTFDEFGGYDPALTGPEDYDLPYRIGKKYKIGRTKKAYILHHEENVSLSRLLKKKYYYANKGALYATKHPELIRTQGNLLFRKAYITHWRNFVRQPALGISFIIVRILETIAAVLGYVKAIGIVGFIKSFINLIK
jgi:glycosyltransferase involved in cell wall biosynthesis